MSKSIEIFEVGEERPRLGVPEIVAKDIEVADDSLVLEHAIVLCGETLSMSEYSPLLLMARKFSRLLLLLAHLTPCRSLGATMLLLSV